ncbi:MAG TPA: UbiA family prenyltransferase [Xanthomonadales bacterium]|nr:UbiA family prenyltransferase [Xanthomonadales bacterium]
MPATPGAVASLLRPHQWAKNALLFVALLTSHRWRETPALVAAALAFAAFCAASSAVYVFNDARDAGDDRLHPDKRRRPFASGALDVRLAWLLVPLLLVVSAAFAWSLPRAAQLALATYAAVAFAYCVLLKRLLWLDVVALAALYTVRVVAGAAAIAVVASPWLLAFAGFLFTSLAVLKRHADLVRQDGLDLAGRAYRAGDAVPLLALGASAGVTAVLVLALYVNSPDVRVLYRTPGWIWLLCPALLYWIARMWTLSARGRIDTDPLLFALRDPASWGVAVAFVAALGLAL